VAGLNIYCIDSSKDITNVLDRFFTFGNVTPVSSVNDMVNKVIDAWNNSPYDIESLVIAGHGGPGFQSVGSGLKWDTTGEKGLLVDASDPRFLVGSGRTELPRLRGLFTQTGVVTLTGCEVARGPEGLQLLKVTSNALNVFVQGGRSTQRPLVPGWEGNVYRCYRSTCWITRYGYLSD